MSQTHALFAEAQFNAVLRNLSTPEERINVVKNIRLKAIENLTSVINRFPMCSEREGAMYKARGLEVPTWDLMKEDDARVLCCVAYPTLQTAAELRWVEILGACIAAEAFGDIPEYRYISMGLKKSATQRKIAKLPRAREFREAVDPQKVAAEYWRDHSRGRVKEIAEKYGITTKTVNNYKNKHPKTQVGN